MRKLSRGLTLLVAVFLISSSVLADNSYQGFKIVNVVVDGRPLQVDVPAVNLNGRTVLPLRAVAEVAGMSVSWDGSTNTATLTSKSVTPDPIQADSVKLKADLAGAQAMIDSLQKRVAELESRPQISPTSNALPAAEVAKIRGLDQAGFESYLNANFGSIGSVQLEFLPVTTDLFAFYIADRKVWESVGYGDKLDWIRRITQVMEARFKDKAFGADLVLRLEYPFIPSTYPAKEIDFDVHGGNWVVRHSVLVSRRSDLPTYGLQLISITVQD